jgi:diketogulonate reductase-like aldo/keto reductase
VELHPYLPQHELLKFCFDNDITLTAYSPLGSDPKNGLLQDSIMNQIAKKHGKTAGQIAIAWALQRKTVVIPKSSRVERIKENLEATKIVLSDEEMNELDNLYKTKGKRFVDPRVFWNADVFEDEI